jgi:hypothetical protein
MRLECESCTFARPEIRSAKVVLSQDRLQAGSSEKRWVSQIRAVRFADKPATAKDM